MESKFDLSGLQISALLFGAIVGLSGGLSGCGIGGGFSIDIQAGLPEGELAEISEIIEFTNDRGETIEGVLVLPKSDEPLPAVVVLHGSGGLYLTPDDDDDELEMEPQFEEWAGLLAAQGYAVVLPSSFHSRGFYEWGQQPDHYDVKDRLLMRVYDAHGALAFACKQRAIDCNRIALLGFSNGASGMLMSVYEGLAEVDGMDELTPADERPSFALGVAYYPGCGLEGMVSMSVPYFPELPVLIHHGERDSLVDDCETRLEQTEEITEREGYDNNPFQMYVYEDAGHSFDNDPGSSDERSARDTARTRTLERLATELK